MVTAVMGAEVFVTDERVCRKCGDRVMDCVRRKATRRYAVFADYAAVVGKPKDTLEIDGRTGKRVGTWWCEDPACWDKDDGEFHKNEGSWCTSNMTSGEEGVLIVEAGPLGKDLRTNGCLCHALTLVRDDP